MHTRFGAFDPEALIALGINRIEVRSRVMDPMVITVGGPSDPRTEALMREIQPSVTLSGNLGTFTIAPYGEPQPGSVSPAIRNALLAGSAGVAAALVGVLLLGGTLLGRR